LRDTDDVQFRGISRLQRSSYQDTMSAMGQRFVRGSALPHPEAAPPPE
jgi:hypothetical protein